MCVVSWSVPSSSKFPSFFLRANHSPLTSYRFKDFNRLLDAQIKPVVDKVFDFEQAVDAYTHLESQKHIGNVVIKVAKN